MSAPPQAAGLGSAAGLDGFGDVADHEVAAHPEPQDPAVA